MWIFHFIHFDQIFTHLHLHLFYVYEYVRIIIIIFWFFDYVFIHFERINIIGITVIHPLPLLKPYVCGSELLAVER